MTTPASIERQLCEYRRRKQKEAEERRAMTVPTDVPSTPSTPATSPYKFLSPVFSFFSSVGTKVTDSLYSAVTPDHLQQDQRATRALFGHANGVHDDVQTRLLPAENASDSDDDLDQSQGGIVARIVRSRSKLQWAALGLKVLLWFLLWELFIIWQFGAVYFLISGFFFIGYNLRNSPRAAGEVSAYSVFNKDLRRIDGTVSPEQLQREMLFRI